MAVSLLRGRAMPAAPVFGKHTGAVFVARSLVRIATSVSCAVALGTEWWQLTIPAVGTSANGYVYWSQACGPNHSDCQTVYVTDDEENTLKTGQLTAAVCLISAVILWRLARIFFMFRRCNRDSEGDTRDRLIDSSSASSGSGSGARTANGSQAGLNSKDVFWSSALIMLAVDVVTMLAIIIAYATFANAITKWIHEDIMDAIGNMFQVVWSYSAGATAAIVAMVLSIISTLGSVAVVALTYRMRNQRAGAAAPEYSAMASDPA